MINILNVLLIIIFLIIVPFLLGLLLERAFDKTGQEVVISRTFVSGFAIMLSVFQLIAVPCVYTYRTFDFLLYLYTGIIVILLVISVFVVNRKIMISSINISVAKIKQNVLTLEKEYKIVGILALLFIIYQASFLVLKTHMDTDDCRFLAEALEAVEKNSLLLIHPITGKVLPYPAGEMIKDACSPYPLWIAVISVLTNLHPTVLAHSVFPILLIPLSYSAFYLLGTHFFKETSKRITYMFILSVVIMFSFESVYALGYTLLTIIWQGRSIVATVMIPYLWYLLTDIYMDEGKVGLKYLSVLVTALAVADLSGTGAMMPSIMGVVFALAMIINYRKIKPAMLLVLLVIPSGAYSIMYRVVDAIRSIG